MESIRAGRGSVRVLGCGEADEALAAERELLRAWQVGDQAALERLRADSDIDLRAGPSVADEKVTLLCEKMPLRDVVRQLSRPFGYTWLRSGKPGEYRYELAQDLKSQLLEAELRNRDRSAALLALDKEINRYRPYLDLSPDDARARARTAPPDEKKRLEQLASWGWGPVHMYFRLSPQQLAALRAGQKLVFNADPEPGQQTLPPDMERGVLQIVPTELAVTIVHTTISPGTGFTSRIRQATPSNAAGWARRFPGGRGRE